jgi:hypothetical protein
MDCEKFDQHVIDALYDELDEVTYAALKRHVEGCSRCASAWANLRATREVGILPIEEPPDDLEARILQAVARVEVRVAWHKTVLRGLAWAGSHAMRPQFAMAAVFFFVIGSSLLFLRPRGEPSAAPVAVRERGTPDPEAPMNETVAAAEAPRALPRAESPAATPLPAASAEGKGDRDSAADGRGALAEARAVRDRSGCAGAVTRFDAVAASFPGTQIAADAMWEEASCYKQMGDRPHAEQLFLALRSTGYRDRAGRELEGQAAPQQNAIAAAAPAAPAPAARARAAAPSPSTTAANGGVPRGAAAPRKAMADQTGF